MRRKYGLRNYWSIAALSAGDSVQVNFRGNLSYQVAIRNAIEVERPNITSNVDRPFDRARSREMGHLLIQQPQVCDAAALKPGNDRLDSRMISFDFQLC